MGDILKKVGTVVNGVKNAIELSQAVREQVKSLTDTQFIRLARKLDVNWRSSGTTSIMLRDLVEVKKKLAEVVDDDT